MTQNCFQVWMSVCDDRLSSHPRCIPSLYQVCVEYSLVNYLLMVMNVSYSNKIQLLKNILINCQLNMKYDIAQILWITMCLFFFFYTLDYSFIHQLSVLLSKVNCKVMVARKLKWIPFDFGWELGFILDRSAIYPRAVVVYWLIIWSHLSMLVFYVVHCKCTAHAHLSLCLFSV